MSRESNLARVVIMLEALVLKGVISALHKLVINTFCTVGSLPTGWFHTAREGPGYHKAFECVNYKFAGVAQW